MKQFLKYTLYREGYRFLRNTTKEQQKKKQSKPDTDTTRNQGIQYSYTPINEVSKETLQQIDPCDFEHLIADLWEQMGWETHVSSSSVDKGVDITAKKNAPYEETALIQAKRYGPNTTVGSPDIQQYNSLKHQQDGADKVIIVTTNDFTSQARSLAEDLNVKLIDGDQLVNIIEQYHCQHLVSKHLDEPIEQNEDKSDTETRQTNSRQNTNAQSRNSAQLNATTIERGSNENTPQIRSNEEIWYLGVGAGVAGWFITIIGVEVLPESLWSLLFFGSWILLPLSIYKDSKNIPSEENWLSYRWPYIVTSAIWIIGVIPGILYFYQRNQHDPVTLDDANPNSVSHNQTDQDNTAAATTNRPNKGSDAPIEGEINHQGKQYNCVFQISPNGRWTVAYSTDRADTSRYFVYDDVELVHTDTGSKIHRAKISNAGDVALLCGVDEREFVVDLRYGAMIHHVFNSDVDSWEFAESGAYVAVVTSNPDSQTYLFSTEEGELMAAHQNKYEEGLDVQFCESEGEEWVVIQTGNDDPAYAIDLDGDVVWEESEDQIENPLIDQDLTVDANTEGNANSTVDTTERNPKEVVETYYKEIVNARNYGRIDEVLSDDFIGHETGVQELGYNDIDQQGYLKGRKDTEKAFPDYRYNIKNMVSEGDTVAVQWKFEGTHKGSMGDVPPTNRSVSYMGMTFMRVEDGKIVEDWEVSDVVALYTQLGLSP